MRPDPDELLRIMRKSLKTVVTPAVCDEWPSYVAKSIERVLEHLERRWLHEIRFLADDTEEMRELFSGLKADLAVVDCAAVDEVGAVVEELDQLLNDPSRASRAVAHRRALAGGSRVEMWKGDRCRSTSPMRPLERLTPMRTPATA